MNKLLKLKEKIIRRLGGVPCTMLFDPVKKMNLAISAVMRNLISKDLSAGKIDAKISVELKKDFTEDGEVLWMPEIEPVVSLKIGAKGKLECEKQGGFFMRDTGDGFVVGTSQVSMDELLDEQKGA